MIMPIIDFASSSMQICDYDHFHFKNFHLKNATFAMIAMYMYMYNVKTYSRKKNQPVNSKFQRPCISMRVNKNEVK